MKKVLFSLSLLFVSAMAFASNSVAVKPIVHEQCTISATVCFYGSDVTFTSTAATCSQAAADVSVSVNALKEMM
jgi:hypothetical protein